MLTLEFEEFEVYDNISNKFIKYPKKTFKFENSLLTIAKWESKWEIPWFSEIEKTTEQNLDFFYFMSTDESFEIIRLRDNHIMDLLDYIKKAHTATVITSYKKGGNSKIMTNEVIYGYMAMYYIPFYTEKWNINRLLKLIEVCGELNNPDKKKMSKEEVIRKQAALNKQRREAK